MSKNKKGCENECNEPNEIIFKVDYKDGAIEYFCSECLSNIIKEVPEIIIKIERV